MKRYIQPFEHANEILTGLRTGALMTTCANGMVNTMSISWGTLGIQWGKPIFTAFVRGCRHTGPMVDQAGEFTVSVPLGSDCRDIIRFCGTKSGRDTDKFAALSLTAVPADRVSAPAIRQLPLTLECRVLYRQQQTPDCMLSEAVRGIYPETEENLHNDFHTAYYGEILAAYILED